MQTGSFTADARSKTLGRRPSTSDTIGDIQRAARLEFAERGFDGATIDGIARRACVSKQLLYYYFGSKADLYALILEETADETNTFKKNSDYDALAPGLALTAFIEDTFNDFIGRPQIIQMTIDEAKHAFAHVSKRSSLASVLQDAIRTVGKILLRGQQDGTFREDIDPDGVFWTIFAMATAWFSHSPMIALVSGAKLEGPEGLAHWQRHTNDFIIKFVAVKS